MIEFHRLILGDRLRNDRFVQALQTVIKKGKTTVADIGSGTGFLSFVASTLGAKECHLYEMSEMLGVSKEIARLNGIKNCKFFRKHSMSVKSPSKVDVVVSETLGNFALEENILETLRDARRFLKPGGIMIPQRLRQFVAPLSSYRLYKEVTLWDEVQHGIDFAPARNMSVNNIYVRRLGAKEIMHDGVRQWEELDFRAENDSVRTASMEWTFDAPRRLFGFGVWWECDLLPGLTLSTSPDAPPTHWEQIYLPVPAPLDVPAGGMLRLRIRCDSRFEVKIHVRWETEILDAAGVQIARYMMDMADG